MTLQTNTSTPKKIAKTLKNFVHLDVTKALLDRSKEVSTETWDSIAERWTYDLDARRPAPAIIENNQLIKPTDLDLATFMQALADRKATIQVPHYKASTTKKAKSDEIVMSTTNRRGRLQGLVSNQDFWSFSFEFIDTSVLKKDALGSEILGAMRKFRMVNPDGTWYEDIDSIDFSPSKEEEAFIEKCKLAFGDELHFETFGHANRWPGFYSEDYVVTKVAIQRAKDEAKWLYEEIKRIEAKYPSLKAVKPLSGYSGGGGESEEGTIEKRLTTAFNAEIDVPWTGDFLPIDEADLKISHQEACERAKFLRYKLVPKLQFHVRVTEFCFYKHTIKNGDDSFPAWIKASWERNYHPIKDGPGSKTSWNRLVLTQIHPGQKGVAIRYRTFEKMAEFRKRPTT